MRCSHWGLASIVVFCSAMAGAATLSAGASYAADECLSGPKGSTQQGKHWYYRIERPSKRQCWYLGDEGRRTSRSAVAQAAGADDEPDLSPPAKTAPVQKREPMQSSVADARAELTKDIAVPFTTMPPIGQQPITSALIRENPAPQAIENSVPPNNWRMAERWPDAQTSNRVAQTDVATPPSPPGPAPAPVQPARIQQENPQQAPVQLTIPQQATSTAPASPSDTAPDMLRMILGILTAAIALAAIFGRLILTHMQPRRRPAPRRPIWQTMVDEHADPVHARASDVSLRARAEADVEDLLRTLRYPEQQHATSPIVSANRGQRPTDRSGARA